MTLRRGPGFLAVAGAYASSASPDEGFILSEIDTVMDQIELEVYD